jgi:hypothetical protein
MTQLGDHRIYLTLVDRTHQVMNSAGNRQERQPTTVDVVVYAENLKTLRPLDGKILVEVTPIGGLPAETLRAECHTGSDYTVRFRLTREQPCVAAVVVTPGAGAMGDRAEFQVTLGSLPPNLFFLGGMLLVVAGALVYAACALRRHATGSAA